MMKYMQGIRGKFIFILLLFTIQIITIFIVTKSFVQKIKDDAVVINLISRQGLLAQDYVKCFFYFLETKKIQNVQAVIKEFDENTNSLNNKKNITLAHKKQIEEISVHFKKMKDAAANLLFAQGDAKKEGYDLMIKQSQDLDTLFTKLYNDLQKKSEENFTIITNIQAGLLIFSFLIVIFMLIFIDKKIISTISNKFKQVAKISTDVNTQIINVEKNTLNMQGNSESMTKSFTQTMEAVTEISKISQSSASLSENATKIAKNSMQNAEEGKKSMELFMEKMNLIGQSNKSLVDEIEKGNKEISSIIEDVNKISEQTKIINDIAFQSKLLSFNASVEAARAGEHGQGFSVVATEIGNFAKASDVSSKQITKLLNASLEQIKSKIEDNQKRVNEVMLATRKHISEGENSAKYCLDIFKSVTREEEEVCELTHSVALSNSEVLNGINQIKDAMINITHNDGKSNYQQISQDILHSVKETKTDNLKMLESINEFSAIILGKDHV